MDACHPPLRETTKPHIHKSFFLRFSPTVSVSSLADDVVLKSRKQRSEKEEATIVLQTVTEYNLAVRVQYSKVLNVAIEHFAIFRASSFTVLSNDIFRCFPGLKFLEVYRSVRHLYWAPSVCIGDICSALPALCLVASHQYSRQSICEMDPVPSLPLLHLSGK